MAEPDVEEQLRRALKSLEQARQQAEDANQRAKDANQRAEDANQRAEEEQKRAEDANKHLRKTTFTEYLDLCHTHLFQSISVQTNVALTTKGGITNPKGKLRPNRLRAWTEFLSTQQHTQERLQSVYADHDEERIFRSLQFIKEYGEQVASRKIASEVDLTILQRETIETPVASIVGHLQSLDSVRSEFNIGDGVYFDNHPNTLSDTAEEVSERLENLRPFTPKNSPPSSSGLQADQICVYTITKDEETLRKLAFVVEYKAPHKLSLACLRSGLRDMEIKSVIDRTVVPPSKIEGIDNPENFEYHADRLVASAITQTFSYMIQGGTQYGYITTGEAFVFLHVRLDDPSIIYYHLAEPGNDVMAQKEAGQEFVHRTAISQVLAFTMLALESEPASQKWIEDTMNTLDIWQVDYEALLRDVPESVRTAPPSSEYRPKTYVPAGQFAMKLRKKSKSANSTCRPDTSPPLEKDDPGSSDASEHEHPPDTPTRPANRKGRKQNRKDGSKNANASRYQSQKRPFCTQRCLYGLAEGGGLDMSCPNVLDHNKTNDQSNQHQLDRQTFLTLLHQQLERNRDDDCHPLGIQGARGALFKITLTSHGYTVAAKGTVRAFAQDLQHECEIYERLKKIQGVYIPICFGRLDLVHPYYYDIGVQIVHMMILSWAGARLDKDSVAIEVGQKRVESMLTQAIKQIHHAGILHRDLRGPNILWNAEMKRVMVIDFERSEVMLGPRKYAAVVPRPKRERGRKQQLLSEKQAVVGLSKKSDDGGSGMSKFLMKQRFEDEMYLAQRGLFSR
ncbi:hypothetical protein DSL72_001686 [Monilinia vaccinii-corymbosi]|uniref:Protein kinase domain-containing protein n=1 Tax=Monilinia vaccinii-corymbosi TaxID=61207 RepID=A0A8A3PAP0_9HELO|nr:hypothetical protein DSL72_001686 [Monilinia vaccinii-corymbosi]